MSDLQFAREIAAQGFRIFPLKSDGSKAPQIIGWQEKATTDPQQITAWWGKWPDAPVGIHTRGLVCVDVDVPSEGGHAIDGRDEFMRLHQLHGFPPTRTADTPSGGRHYIYNGAPADLSLPKHLGPGIDLKAGEGCLIVAYPAQGKVTPCPQWILERKRTATTSEHQGVAVSDAPDELMQRAREAIAKRPKGDEAFATACLLRDHGVGEAQALSILMEHDGRPESILGPKVAHCYQFAKGEPGGKVATLDDFAEIVGPDGEPLSCATLDDFDVILSEHDHTNLRVRRIRPLSELNPGPALWENTIPERGVFAIGALPGRMKSYTAAGLCYALASDAGEFLGRKLPKGTAAVYVDLERAQATEQRISVWCAEDKRTTLDLFLIEGDVRLNAPDTVVALVQMIRTLTTRPISLVIIDSLGVSLPGVETNSAGPASMAGRQLRRIRDALNCAVGVVAHSPKSGEETVAGSMQFDAIFDTTIFVRGEEDGAGGTLYVKKDNTLALEEAERYIEWTKETVGVPLGPERAVKVHRMRAGSSGAPQSHIQHGRLKGRAQLAWEAFLQLTHPGGSVTDEKWREHCSEFLNPSRRQDWPDIRRVILAANYIERTGDQNVPLAQATWRGRRTGGD